MIRPLKFIIPFFCFLGCEFWPEPLEEWVIESSDFLCGTSMPEESLLRWKSLESPPETAYWNPKNPQLQLPELKSCASCTLFIETRKHEIPCHFQSIYWTSEGVPKRTIQGDSSYTMAIQRSFKGSLEETIACQAWQGNRTFTNWWKQSTILVSPESVAVHFKTALLHPSGYSHACELAKRNLIPWDSSQLIAMQPWTQVIDCHGSALFEINMKPTDDCTTERTWEALTQCTEKRGEVIASSQEIRCAMHQLREFDKIIPNGPYWARDSALDGNHILVVFDSVSSSTLEEILPNMQVNNANFAIIRPITELPSCYETKFIPF